MTLSWISRDFFLTKGTKKDAKAQRKTMENEISHKIIGAAIEVHRILGSPGLLESVYESSLCHELQLRGFEIQRKVIISAVFYHHRTVLF